jgi:hypothetical protein
MKKIMILFVAAMAFTAVGCKKKGGAGEAIAKMEEFANKMCACKDAKCAQGVSDEMTKWGSEEAKKSDKAEMKYSDEEQKKLATATEKMTKCMTTAMTPGGDMAGSAAMGGSGEAGSAAPPAGGSGEAGSAAAPAGGSGEAGSAAAPAGGSAEKK